MREEGRRRWNRDRPLAEIRRSEQAETGAWDEVEAAVLARSAGCSRAEVRQMLIAELQSLNRPVPDDRIPAAILDSFGAGIVVSLERDPAGGDPVPVVVYSGEDLVSGRSARWAGR